MPIDAARASYSRPSTPTDNAYIESFIKSVREEVLGRFAFRNTALVQRMLEDWRIRYNAARPQKALGWLPPIQYAQSHSIDKKDSARIQ